MAVYNCSTCTYFLSGNEVMGQCRRYPQSYNKHRVEWCGEWWGQEEKRKPGRPRKVEPTLEVVI